MKGNIRRRVEELERDPRLRPRPNPSKAYLRIKGFMDRYKEARSSGDLTEGMEEAAKQVRAGIRRRLGRTGAQTGPRGEGRR